jgi:hypothetical protein
MVDWRLGGFRWVMSAPKLTQMFNLTVVLYYYPNFCQNQPQLNNNTNVEVAREIWLTGFWIWIPTRMQRSWIGG